MDDGLDRRTTLRSAVGFLVAAIVLYLFGWVLGWGAVLDAVGDADARFVAVACASSAVALTAWALAWDEVLGVIDVAVPTPQLVVTYFAATFADYVTPFGKAGGGPFVAWVLSTDHRANYGESLASVVTADGLNLVPFFTFAGLGVLGLALGGAVPAGVRPLVYGLGAMAVGLPLAGAFVWRHEDRVVAVVRWVGSVVGRSVDRVDANAVEERTREFFDTLDSLGEDPYQFGETLAFAYVGWAFFALPLWLSGVALGVSLDPLLVAFVVPASSLASFVPTPGGLGGVEAALVGLLVALGGLAPPVAAAVALLYRVASYWFVLLAGGGASLWLVWSR